MFTIRQSSFNLKRKEERNVNIYAHTYIRTYARASMYSYIELFPEK